MATEKTARTELLHTSFRIAMDPLTPFGLACNVIQVVDFSLNAFVKVKQIYQQGALTQYQDL